MWNHGSKGSCVCENLPAQTLESGVGSLNNIVVPYFYCLKWSIYSADKVIEWKLPSSLSCAHLWTSQDYPYTFTIHQLKGR